MNNIKCLMLMLVGLFFFNTACAASWCGYNNLYNMEVLMIGGTHNENFMAKKENLNSAITKCNPPQSSALRSQLTYWRDACAASHKDSGTATSTTKSACNEGAACQTTNPSTLPACFTSTTSNNKTTCTTRTAGYYFNTSTKKCTACSAPNVLNTAKNTCAPCAAPNVYSNGACVTCKDPSVYNTTTKSCVECSAPTAYNSTSKACAACPSPTVYNASSKSCEACASPKVYNAASKSCEACAAPLVFNNGTCVACSGQTPIYNATTKACISETEQCFLQHNKNNTLDRTATLNFLKSEVARLKRNITISGGRGTPAIQSDLTAKRSCCTLLGGGTACQ